MPAETRNDTSSNRLKRPGASNMPQTRRTTLEVQEANAAKEAAKAEKNTKDKKSIQRMAKKELNSLAKQKKQLEGSQSSTPKLRISFKRHKKGDSPAPTTKEQEPETPAPEKQEPEVPVPDEPAVGGEAREPEVGEDNDLSQSEAEPDDAPKPRKKRKGVAKREAVRKHRDEMTTQSGDVDAVNDVAPDDVNQQKQKRKASISNEEVPSEAVPSCPPAKKAKLVTSAIRNDKPKPLLPPPTASSSNKNASSNVEPEEPESAFQDGGLCSEGEELKHPGVEAIRGGLGTRYKNLVRVKSIRRSKPAPKHKRVRHRPTRKSLPGETDSTWSDVQTLAFDAMARLDPWESLTEDDVLEIWNTINGETHWITLDDGTTEDQKEWWDVIQFLIKRDVGTRWIHGISQASEEALAAEWEARSLESREDRAAFVKTMLGDDEVKSKNRPFIWEGYDAYPNIETVTKKGGVEVPKKGNIFKGCLLSRTLAKHLELVTEPLKSGDLEINMQPRGVLMMCIIAMTRTLMFSKTGAYEPPSGKMGEFSGDNWGDRFTSSIDKKDARRIHLATLFKEYIDKMGEEQWSGIMEKAASYIGDRKRGGKGKEDEEIPWATSDEEELRDSDYDGGLD
ncbi:hypothetical protein BDN72DRAFT_876076 [Pluteus cervinus]|uniref:Uncharacterized protein n=1 Tax=Pluteus cervinus TaxID=181527 RepID=A0ACD3B5R4_9AGAR|nr:hypothetical protein BDN72DRAFT_876076 [Pluteus cervinus]